MAPDGLIGAVRDTLRSLGSRRPGAGLLVQVLPGASAYHVGFDDAGRIALVAPPEPLTWPPLRLERLTFSPAVRSQITDAGGSREERDVAVVLLDVGGGVFGAALPALIAGVITAAGPQPGPGDLGRAVRALRDVFQALSRDATRSYIGVWGELFVIRQAARPEVLAAAWGSDPTQSFDFALQGERLEIKTTLQAVRRHHFSYSQLLAARISAVTVVSVQTAPSPDGATAGDLVGEVLDTLRQVPAIAGQVLHRASAVLGRQLFDDMSPRYDRLLAQSTLAMFPFAEVPAVDLQFGVVDVNWTAELDAAPTLAVSGTLAEAAAPAPD
jgi:Putative  PD-(D/E)XK family member, (DUF4420)